MRHAIYLLLVLLLGCSAERGEDATTLRPRLGSASPPAPSWLAFDLLDRPVRFDPVTGAVLEQGPPLPGVERDLAFDPWTGRVAVFASPEGDGGAVHLLGPTLAPDAPPFPVDGRVELWFGPEGLWLFEESYGERWRRVRHDQQWEPSWTLPPPSSVWDATGASFGAIIEDGGHASWLTFDPTAPAIAQAFAFSGIVPTRGAVRATPVDGGLAIAWAVAGGVLVCTVDGQGAVVHERLLTLPGEVRQAVTLSTPHGPWIALALLDGADPLAASWIVALDPYADAVTPSHLLSGGLDDDRRVDRRMIADGERLIVATTTGLEALELTLDPPVLSADPSFAGDQLRGPLEQRAGMFFQSAGESAL